MEEKDALPNTPERSCSELIGSCATLRDAVRKTLTHVVDEDIGEEIHSLVRKRGTRNLRGAAGNHPASGERRRVTLDTTYLCEEGPSIHDGRRAWRRRGRRQHPHEVRERLDVREDGCIGVGSGRGGGREVECVLGRR